MNSMKIKLKGKKQIKNIRLNEMIRADKNLKIIFNKDIETMRIQPEWEVEFKNSSQLKS